MRIALAQVNPVVGDLDGNALLALEAIASAEAQGAGLTLLPELVLTGYPPEDLLLREDFVEANLDALERVAAGCGHYALVGFVDRDGDQLFNAAALCGNHRVLSIYHKRRLPNYGVFDEHRYFVPGENVSLTDMGGSLVSATVCEDIWFPEIAQEIAQAGAGVILNISASPYHVGKGAEREEMLRARARDNGVWVAYCNLVGGQDELVFDGRSVVISPDGEVVARGRAFAPDLVIADFTPGAKLGASADLAPVLEGPEDLYEALVTGVRDYVSKNGFTDVVLGLSGGIDSALVATIATDALGPDHVHGVLLPGRYSSAGSIQDALALAASLGIDARTLSIEPAFSALLETLAPSFRECEPDIAEENLQARIRGTLVMALSNKFGWLALATGNKSESSVGYGTLYGDMAGGFAPIKDVFKLRVYELAKWRNSLSDGPVIPHASISKPPSAELKPGQCDQDSLPPYEILDAVLERYVELDLDRDSIVADGFDPSMVDHVIRLTDRAEFKRRQSAPGIKITPKAFGKDRRMPITNRYGR